MTIELSKKSEIEEITRMSKEAFDTDILVGGDEIGGPPEYDSLEWHYQMLNSKNLYSIYTDNGELVGGMLLFSDDTHKELMYFGRVFIDPKYHRKGYGIASMKAVEEKFPETTVWRLDTPIWNKRTNSFYPKIGYKEIKRDDDMIYYEKIIE